MLVAVSNSSVHIKRSSGSALGKTYDILTAAIALGSIFFSSWLTSDIHTYENTTASKYRCAPEILLMSVRVSHSLKATEVPILAQAEFLS